jgi:hypothetical protein
MLQGIDVNQIKQYNASLKQYKDKAANLNAEIEYTNKELDALCKELTAELGVEVTRDNVEQIYNEQVEKINSTLQSGNAVLAKIAGEEQKALEQPQQVQSQPTVQSQPVVPTMPVAPQLTQPTAPVPPVQPQTVFNGQATTMPGQSLDSLQQPLFHLG